MSCTHCGTPLPTGALFCGECGRSVASSKLPQAVSAVAQPRLKPTPVKPEPPRPTPVRWVEDPVTGHPLVDEAGGTDDADDDDVEIGPAELHCEQCDSPMDSDDIFCGECGFVSRSITKAFSASDFTGETRQIDLSQRVELEADAEAEPAEEGAAELDGPASDLHDSAAELLPEPASQAPVAELPPFPRQPDLVIPPAPVRRSAPPTPRAPVAAPAVGIRPTRSFLDEDDVDDAADLEATRIVSRISGNRFVLQFSTGESFTVHGSGLVGRNPQPEPGEFFDHLVRVLDSGKSVSKTHLEFGQEGGAFWLKDRFSGNGTIIREPDISARRAEPNHRYRVVRGTRIDIGEQFFIVS